MDWNIAFRPRKWDNIIGQKHLKPVIQQALLNGKFPRFSLFSGPSGVGKSTMAELCAMSIACESSLNEPCCNCNSCRAFIEGKSLNIKKYNMAKMLGKRDVVEVLDDIFKFESIQGLTIYILEEIHVLRDNEQSPFLEELTKIPDDVYIMACTTQPYKVLAEIRNRATPFYLEIPTSVECREFIKKICKGANVPIPDINTLKTLVEVCENTPRKLISTIELFSTVGLTSDKIAEFFGLEVTSVYIDLLEKLKSSVSYYEFVDFVEDFSEKEISAIKVVRGFDNFMVDVLLERSSSKKFKLIQEGERLSKVTSELGEVEILKIMNFISKRDYSSTRNESSAKFYLLHLKLSMLGTNVLSSNLSNATAIKIESQETARKQNKLNTSKGKGLTSMDATAIQRTASMFFTEEEDDEDVYVEE